jgi:type VI protein secretion system component VasF
MAVPPSSEVRMEELRRARAAWRRSIRVVWAMLAGAVALVVVVALIFRYVLLTFG